MAKQKKEKSAPASKAKLAEKKNFFSEKYFPHIIFAFSFLLYFNSVFNDYNLDDELVTQNHRLTSKGISAIPEIFRSPYYQDNAGYKYEYRPIVLVSFAIEHSIFGDKPLTSHLINVLLYAALCLLLFHVLKKLLYEYNPLFPFLIAMIYAAHPIHTEVVDSIKNRDEILALIFGLLALFFAESFCVRKNWIALILTPLFFILGILSKSTTISFVVLIPLALILLTKADFGRVFLTVILLLIPSLLLTHLFTVAQQVYMAAAIIVAVLGLYVLKNGLPFFESLKNSAEEIFRTGEAGEKTDNISFKLNFSFLRNPLVVIVFVCVTTVLTTASAAGIYAEKIWLSAGALLLLGVYYWYSRKEVQLLLLTPITLLITYYSVKSNMAVSLTETALIVFLITNFISGGKKLRYAAIGNFLINYLTLAVCLHKFNYAPVVLLAVFFNRKLKWVSIIAAMLMVVALMFKGYKAVVHNQVSTMVYSSIFMLTVFILLWRNFIIQVNRVSVIAIPVLLALSFFVTPPKRSNNELPSVLEAIHFANATASVDLYPVQSVRPLGYVEFPMDSATTSDIRLGTASLTLGKYLQLTLFPYPLSFYYGFAEIKPTSVKAVLPLLVLFIHILMLATAIFFIRKLPLLSFALLFYLGSVSLYSNLAVPLPGMVGERLLLIPSVGFCMLLVFMVSKIAKLNWSDLKLDWNKLSPVFRYVMLCVFVLYSVLSFSRNFNWHDRITLFRHDIAVVESSAQAQNLLALHLFLEADKLEDKNAQQQMRQEAIPHFRKALEVYPNFLNASFDLARTYDKIGQEYIRMGNAPVSNPYFDSALAQYIYTLPLDTGFVLPCFQIGIIYQHLGMDSLCIPYFEKYLTHFPAVKQVYANLSFAYYKIKKYDESLAVNKRAIAKIPGTYEPFINIAKTYYMMGNKDSSLVYFEQALRLKPADAAVLSSVIDLSEQLGYKEKANHYKAMQGK